MVRAFCALNVAYRWAILLQGRQAKSSESEVKRRRAPSSALKRRPAPASGRTKAPLLPGGAGLSAAKPGRLGLGYFFVGCCCGIRFDLSTNNVALLLEAAHPVGESEGEDGEDRNGPAAEVCYSEEQAG